MRTGAALKPRNNCRAFRSVSAVRRHQIIPQILAELFVASCVSGHAYSIVKLAIH